MFDAIVQPPVPENEPNLTFAPGTPERAEIKAELERQAKSPVELPMYIGGKLIETGDFFTMRSPHNRELVLGKAHQGGAQFVTQAIDSALGAHRAWSEMSFASRAAIFLRAGEMLATTHRARINAATMLGQSKTVVQAEIDAACELIDFIRFNVDGARRIAEDQPLSPRGTWNILEPRPLEGFVLAITPFNFTAIAGNLPMAPALMGNTVVWKPAMNSLRSTYEILQLLREAGLPDGVINMVIGPPPELAEAAIAHPALAGVHFTGSTQVFRGIWKQVGNNIDKYRSYPRIVGETGGKDFIFAHPSADLDTLAVAMVRGAFEYQGQKCSAASRAFIPKSIYKQLIERVSGHIDTIKMGDVTDFSTLMGAVIDERAFARLKGAIDAAKSDANTTIVKGGVADDSKGYFVSPTVIETKDPRHDLMQRELFGPVLTVWVYDDNKIDEALTHCDETAAYALTGAVFARDRAFIDRASAKLRFAAGNFYINDKPTGSIVGQQPFGGARGSGTNDKAGSHLNLLRWVSPRAIKENLVPPRAIGYPSMSEP